MYLGFLTLLFSLFIFAPTAHARQCIGIFELREAPLDIALNDARDEYTRSGGTGFLKIGEGNSGSIFLYKNQYGEFKVAKFYKPERAQNLERDHLGLKEVQMLFDRDQFHDIQFRVAKSEIVDNLQSVHGTRALIMDYHWGYNLHTLLISTPKNHPLHIQAEQLYQRLVKELDVDARREGLRDELRPETERYFQDHIVDGLPMLEIDGRPRLLIKTDNIIFNPIENTLTLIDPF